MRKYLKSTDFIMFEVRDRVARITLNRPDKRNAINPQMSRELHDALIEADALADVNVILLAGAGKDFCAGFDLAGRYAGKPDDPNGIDETKYRTLNATLDDDSWHIEDGQRDVNTLFDIHKPVIAKVQGNCMAGGTDLALMCDMILVAEDAKIGFPATRANGTPANNMWLYHVGPQWAKRMLMTGDSLWGRDAARIGLVLDAFPAAELDAAADELARRVSCIDGELLAAHKRVVNVALELGGARTLQRMAAELDARAHLSQGPRRKQFKADMASGGLKQALTNRDAPFGDSMVKIHWASK
ncbi:MAG: crotonase/enoyl-CoA hydratase family protein [Rhodospirillaceae bacterium]|nr:MAG: crotonase/enoyl-CoA hydratase family protein [Rhodospirillaceae bacterium]